MQTFEEAWKSLKDGETTSVLLGNGFSRSWKDEIFSYANLLKVADFGRRDGTLRELFQRFATYDFEAVMKKLIAAAEVIGVYGGGEQLLAQVKDDKQALKDALIAAIIKFHPNRPSEISDDQYISVRRFLSRFEAIFTVNYDLLMYWARNKNNLAPENYTTDDGFRDNSTWNGHETNQQIHFLHGGLHIYDTGDVIKKHQCTDDGVTIIEHVRSNFNQDSFPLFVSEPTYSQKKIKINHNPYLNYCFKKIRDLNGTLFIHGHSIDENDRHIFDQIKASQVSRVYVSIYGDENSETNTRTRNNALAFLQCQNTKVMFYDAASAPVWA